MTHRSVLVGRGKSARDRKDISNTKIATANTIQMSVCIAIASWLRLNHEPAGLADWHRI